MTSKLEDDLTLKVAIAMHEAGHQAGYFNYGWNRVQPHAVEKYLCLAKAAIHAVNYEKPPVTNKLHCLLSLKEQGKLTDFGKTELEAIQSYRQEVEFMQ